MRQDWDPEDVVAAWTLVEDDWRLVSNKSGPTRLGFVLLLKFFEQEGRFPSSGAEIPRAAVAYVAEQVGVAATEIAGYDWSGRSIKYHRAQIREALGFREPTRGDEAKLTDWLAEEVAPTEMRDGGLREAALVRCRAERIEPPGRLDRIVSAARAAATTALCAGTVARLSAPVEDRLERLGRGDEDPGHADHHQVLLTELKADPARLTLKTLLGEIDKLERVRALGVPEDVFSGVPERVVEAWRTRAATEYPSDLADHPREVRLTLLAALCHCRRADIIDGLVELVIALVHRLRTRAENRVEEELVADLRRVRNKQQVLFRLARAALEHPDETVRDALYPVVAEETLRQLVAEADADDAHFRARVRTVLRSSYSNHYRRMLPRLLEALEFRSNSPCCRVLDAIALLRRYASRPGSTRYYRPDDTVPLEGIVPSEWRDAVVDDNGRVERIPYELCTLRALRDALRRREVWVVGARRWRDPEADLPADFEENRPLHYAALRQPLDPTTFVDGLRERLGHGLDRLAQAMAAGATGGVRIEARGDQPWIVVPRLEPMPEPARLGLLKGEVIKRWGIVELIDMLAEADHLVGFTSEFRSVAPRQSLAPDVLRRRLLLVLFALGTNTGISRVAGADSGEPEAALRHVRRLYVNRDNLRRAVARLVDATLGTRDTSLWGEATACASDSKRFGAWDANLMTEWHNRYRGPGVMIYWHVERKSICVRSQLKNCSSSEVAAMIEGVLHHCSEASFERNYVDTHGQSAVGFAFSELLGFQLLARLKNIGSQRLYRPGDAVASGWRDLTPVLTRPIRWELIANQYDQMVKYATALRLRTAESESILRRFTRPGPQHPTHAALADLGRAVKSIFLCDYLASADLRREVHQGLQVVEQWNSANGYIFSLLTAPLGHARNRSCVRPRACRADTPTAPPESVLTGLSELVFESGQRTCRGSRPSGGTRLPAGRSPLAPRLKPPDWLPASRNGHTWAVPRLIERGTPVDDRLDEVTGASPLHLAAGAGDLESSSCSSSTAPSRPSATAGSTPTPSLGPGSTDAPR